MHTTGCTDEGPAPALDDAPRAPLFEAGVVAAFVRPPFLAFDARFEGGASSSEDGTHSASDDESTDGTGEASRLR